MQAIYFDMDGTIADLYGCPNWLEDLHNEDVRPYIEAKPLVDMDHLANLLEDFVDYGITIGVISWSAMNGSKAYNKATRKAKLEWINSYLNCISEFHVVKYGTPKYRVAKVKDSILVDDNEDVRAAWKNGNTRNAQNAEEMINALETLLNEIKGLKGVHNEQTRIYLYLSYYSWKSALG